MENKNTKIRSFIYSQIGENPSGLIDLVSREFGFSRQRAHWYIAKEIKEGRIVKVGATNSTRYFAVGGKKIEFDCKIKPGLADDKVWNDYVKPMLSNCTENVRRIANFGFTEMYNNAIDHSGGTRIYTRVQISDKEIRIIIMDNGIGIFRKIQLALHLDNIRESVLHLSKGKFTTDPKNHTGQGIFFASRMFDQFIINSSGLVFVFRGNDWLLSTEKNESFGNGTWIEMILPLQSARTPAEIFNQYSGVEDGFWKTTVAVALSSDPNDPHVSRSQAKRLIMGLEKFKTVVLDFKNVVAVGQAFVDEVFRVFQNEYPEIIIKYVNANEEVESMIRIGLAESKNIKK